MTNDRASLMTALLLWRAPSLLVLAVLDHFVPTIPTIFLFRVFAHSNVDVSLIFYFLYNGLFLQVSSPIRNVTRVLRDAL